MFLLIYVKDNKEFKRKFKTFSACKCFAIRNNIDQYIICEQFLLFRGGAL